MRLSRLAVLPLIAAAAIGLTACNDEGATGSPLPGGGAANAPAASTKLDLCGVLTLDRAKKLIGDDAKPDDKEPTKCSYNAESKGYSVTANYELDSDGHLFDLSRKIGGQADKVDGVGEDAFFHSSVNTLYVRKGTVNLDVQIVNDLQGQAVIDAEKTLAADILK
jgi:hypothetical protein